LKRAYVVHGEAGILFDSGECHRLLGQNAEALDSYRSYLRRKPDAANRAAVETLIAKLEAGAKTSFRACAADAHGCRGNVLTMRVRSMTASVRRTVDITTAAQGYSAATSYSL
jgi:hypothetical protein